MVTRVEIDESAVRSFIQPGGSVHNLLFSVVRMNQVHSKAILAAGGHVRSWRLFNSIQTNRPKSTGPLTGVAQTYANARHAIYVEEGTSRITTAKPMVVPTHRTPHLSPRTKGAGSQLFLASGGKGTVAERGYFHTHSVEGQPAVRYLQRGMESAMKEHGL